jgi:hypothetical protein
MRNLHPLIGLTARLLFGFSVLAFFGFVSVEMATHYFQGVAERTVRQAFTDGVEAKSRVRYDAVCGIPEFDRTPFPECDPIAVKAKRSLRSTSCGSRGLLRFLGKQWSCVAEFTDGAALNVHVSLGFGRHHLELVLPFREPGAQDRH